MQKYKSIKPFLDENGKITQLPRKQVVRLMVLEYLADKFEPDTEYTEQQVNEICNRWHTFDDYFFYAENL